MTIISQQEQVSALERELDALRQGEQVKLLDTRLQVRPGGRRAGGQAGRRRGALGQGGPRAHHTPPTGPSALHTPRPSQPTRPARRCRSCRRP
jgi:hypothetical protein